jgi:hypothetical protein
MAITLIALLATALASPPGAAATNHYLPPPGWGIEMPVITADPDPVDDAIERAMADLPRIDTSLRTILASQPPSTSEAQMQAFGIGHLGRETIMERREAGKIATVNSPSSIWLFSLAITAILVGPVLYRVIKRRRKAKAGEQQHPRTGSAR